MLGEGAFTEELAQTRHLTAQAVAERIRQLVADFTDAPQHDDMAVLAIRVEQGAPRTPTEAAAPAQPRPEPSPVPVGQV
jgi:hypothetical protein